MEILNRCWIAIWRRLLLSLFTNEGAALLRDGPKRRVLRCCCSAEGPDHGGQWFGRPPLSFLVPLCLFFLSSSLPSYLSQTHVSDPPCLIHVPDPHTSIPIHTHAPIHIHLNHSHECVLFTPANHIHLPQPQPPASFTSTCRHLHLPASSTHTATPIHICLLHLHPKASSHPPSPDTPICLIHIQLAPSTFTWLSP